MITIKLPNAEIRIDGSTLASEGLREEIPFDPEQVKEGRVDTHDAKDFNLTIDGMESLLLALHCAGFDLSTPKIAEAVQSAVESIANNF